MKERETFGSRLGFILVSAAAPLVLETYGNSHTWQDNTEVQHLF